MIINGLNSPNDWYLKDKSHKMSRYGGYIYNITTYNIVI